MPAKPGLQWVRHYDLGFRKQSTMSDRHQIWNLKPEKVSFLEELKTAPKTLKLKTHPQHSSWGNLGSQAEGRRSGWSSFGMLPAPSLLVCTCGGERACQLGAVIGRWSLWKPGYLVIAEGLLQSTPFHSLPKVSSTCQVLLPKIFRAAPPGTKRVVIDFK